MRRIKLIVAYDGTEYSGWQIQPEAPTIEMYLDKAIRELTGENVHVTGASPSPLPVMLTAMCIKILRSRYPAPVRQSWYSPQQTAPRPVN